MVTSGKQQLLAFILILMVLFLMPTYMEIISPPQPESPTTEPVEENPYNSYEYIEEDYVKSKHDTVLTDSIKA